MRGHSLLLWQDRWFPWQHPILGEEGDSYLHWETWSEGEEFSLGISSAREWRLEIQGAVVGHQKALGK